MAAAKPPLAEMRRAVAKPLLTEKAAVVPNEGKGAIGKKGNLWKKRKE